MYYLPIAIHTVILATIGGSPTIISIAAESIPAKSATEAKTVLPQFGVSGV